MQTEFPSRSSASSEARLARTSPARSSAVKGHSTLSTLSVSISAVEDNAVFQIYAPSAQAERRDFGVEIVGAKALPGAGEGEDAKRWSGVLPNTGTYLVAVGPTYGNATYVLRVAIK